VSSLKHIPERESKESSDFPIRPISMLFECDDPELFVIAVLAVGVFYLIWFVGRGMFAAVGELASGGRFQSLGL
jgi:hypothetical protein